MGLLYVASEEGIGFSEQYSLMTENADLADSIIESMK